MSRGRLRIGQVALLLCVAAVWLVPAASADAAISGTVTDSSAQPLEGIEVCAQPTTPLHSAGCTQTDAAGAYSIPAAEPGYLVHFYSRNNSAPGYASQWYPDKAFSTEAEPVTEAQATHVDATMVVGGTVTGQVVNAHGFQPVAGVEVCPAEVPGHGDEVTSCDVTDAEGKYALRGLSATEYRFAFLTAGEVNFVDELSEGHTIEAGSTLVRDAQLVPGVEVKGTVTEAGTGLPVEGLAPPDSVPSVCAIDVIRKLTLKCTIVGPGGHYSIPGLPPSLGFGIVFARDSLEEGEDLHPDGYTRQYWDEVPTWAEATYLSGSGGSIFAGVDAHLTRGAEVFPPCEEVSACPPPPGGSTPPPQGTNPISLPAPALPLVVTNPPVHCKRGFRKVVRSGGARCVKIAKKHKPRHHRRPAKRTP